MGMSVSSVINITYRFKNKLADRYTYPYLVFFLDAFFISVIIG